jgi:hypothetical protein
MSTYLELDDEQLQEFLTPMEGFEMPMSPVINIINQIPDILGEYEGILIESYEEHFGEYPNDYDAAMHNATNINVLLAYDWAISYDFITNLKERTVYISKDFIVDNLNSFNTVLNSTYSEKTASALISGLIKIIYACYDNPLANNN